MGRRKQGKTNKQTSTNIKELNPELPFFGKEKQKNESRQKQTGPKKENISFQLFSGWLMLRKKIIQRKAKKRRE